MQNEMYIRYSLWLNFLPPNALGNICSHNKKASARYNCCTQPKLFYRFVSNEFDLPVILLTATNFKGTINLLNEK